MWEYQCEAERKRGGRCSRRSHYAVYTWQFQGEHFDAATWVEVCGHHYWEALPNITAIELKGKCAA